MALLTPVGPLPGPLLLPVLVLGRTRVSVEIVATRCAARKQGAAPPLGQLFFGGVRAAATSGCGTTFARCRLAVAGFEAQIPISVSNTHEPSAVVQSLGACSAGFPSLGRLGGRR